VRFGWLALAAVAMAVPATAQVRTVDPNQAIDSDIQGPPPARDVQQVPNPPAEHAPPPPATAQAAPGQEGIRNAAEDSQTYQHDDVLHAAEGVFGKGAAGLAGIIEKILKNQGRPNAYIAGSEAAGAVGIGLRYGHGVLSHKVEGTQPIFWTGPSLGFDLGGDATKVFVLVYNLYDTQDLYERFPAGEGRLYAVGGFSAAYLRKGNIVLIPVRLGVGWRAGVNVGYMKFRHTAHWVPF
jgi:hypothetical protein